MRSTEHGTPEPSEPSPESSPFDKAPWLFQKGNKMGAGRRDMARKRLEHPAWESRDGPREILAAHEKITVRRNTLSRAAAMIDEAAAEEARDREVRRPRGEVQRLEEEKRDLERRLATVERELEKARAKMPRGNATS